MKNTAIIFAYLTILLLLLAVQTHYFTKKLSKKEVEIVNLKLALKTNKEESEQKYSKLKDSLLIVINAQNNERYKLAGFTRFLIPMCFENPVSALECINKFDSTMNVINNKFNKNLK